MQNESSGVIPAQSGQQFDVQHMSWPRFSHARRLVGGADGIVVDKRVVVRKFQTLGSLKPLNISWDTCPANV